MNKPISGNTNPKNGTSESDSITFTSPVIFNWGNTQNSIMIDMIEHAITIDDHAIFLVSHPAKNLPIANDMAKIEAICTLSFSENENIF